MESYITIGEIIRHYRKEKGLSQEALSKGICDRKYLGHIENNRNIPTLDIINQLSDRLEINLYDTYALMLRHHDIDTHKKIEYINNHIGTNNPKILLDLVKEYEQLSGFQNGEPLQYLKYIEALYYSNHLKQNDKAITIALEGLSVTSPFSIDEDNFKRYFSNVELTLLNVIAVAYCRSSNMEEGKKYFDFLQKYIYQLFAQSHYATNKNNQFELRFLSVLVCNYFLFFRADKGFRSESIDETLELLKSLSCHHMLPELLLCKTYMLLQTNDIEKAKITYHLSHQLGLYLYNSEYQNSIEHKILADLWTELGETSKKPEE